VAPGADPPVVPAPSRPIAPIVSPPPASGFGQPSGSGPALGVGSPLPTRVPAPPSPAFGLTESAASPAAPEAAASRHAETAPPRYGEPAGGYDAEPAGFAGAFTGTRRQEPEPPGLFHAEPEPRGLFHAEPEPRVGLFRAEPEPPGLFRTEPEQPWLFRAEPEPREEYDADPEPAPAKPGVDFDPANDVEASLLHAVEDGNTDSFLSTLLLAKVLVQVSPDTPGGALPGDPGFGWQTEDLDDQSYIVVFTSPERLRDHAGGQVETVMVKFVQLISHWPDKQWSFAVNPGTPVGAKLPGAQIVALASWAEEVGLTGDPIVEAAPEEPAPIAAPRRSIVPAAVPAGPTMMQKVVPPAQVPYYLDRGYDRVSGFVNRAAEVAHLRTPADLVDALGLSYRGSAFSRDAGEMYVLRWAAHCPTLYRIPYGGQHEAGMRAMQGWVIERPPFRGNGFAPGDSSDIIAEFKVDSARLPNGAQLWRVSADGTETLVAMLDVDGPQWRPVEP
jgi:hypothetical protein